MIVSFPTGCGRSLCYQLPAVANSPKLTIVFCSQIDRIKVRYFFLIKKVAIRVENSKKEEESILNQIM